MLDILLLGVRSLINFNIEAYISRDGLLLPRI